MSAAEYDQLGFMCGLEVHQQLATQSKLFCRCPAGIRSKQVDAEVLRHMRPTLSELGEYDGTALMEFKTKKEIVYQLERCSVCTYELDDTPPFEIDQESIGISIEVAKLLNLNLVSELHVMRKQYLDGSIPTGFQRTAMVGLSGSIPFRESELGSDRQLRVRQLSLEEDSCREVSDVGHRVVFRTDRLGMPLIESVTEPDLLTPDDVKAGADLLARVVRATGRVRRGAGAARQDVNVSIAGGRRVEIKGVSSHRLLPKLVHIEAFRQLNLLRVRAELQSRGVTPETYDAPDADLPWEESPLIIDARAALKKVEFVPIRDALDNDEMVCAVRLPGFRGLLAHRTQPGVTFAREVADRARVIACLTGRPFMIHSDVHDYGLTEPLWSHLRIACKAESSDAVVVLWGNEQDVATAACEVLARAQEALVGVPAETRQAFANGTTGFERILPGADRMYPDTDTPPVPILDAWVADAEKRMPVRPWDREDHYRRLGLSDNAARRLAAAPWAALFDELAPAKGVPARRLAAGLEKRLPEQWRLELERVLPSAERLAPLVVALEAGGAFLEVFETMLTRLLRQPECSAEQLIAEIDASDPEASLQGLIAETVAKRIEVKSDDRGAMLRWAMGRVMPPLRGRVDARSVRNRLVEELGAAP